jgi:hypothetical protein
MNTVTVVFTNGNIVTFDAQEFDADLSGSTSLLNRYAYKDAQGEDSTIFLKPEEVAGVFLTKNSPGKIGSIAYTTPGGAGIRPS